MLVTLAAFGVAATGANGATTLGPTLPGGAATNNLPCGGPTCTYMNTLGGVGAPRQATPGVITSWHIQSGSAGGPVRLRVLRPTTPGEYRAITSSATQTTTASLDSFATRLPIQAGDVIGVENGSSALIFTPALATTYFFSSAFADGVTGTPQTSSTGAGLQLLANATVEPDVDGDGFGDETQDACPADGTRQAAPCAPAFAVGPVTLSPARIRLPVAARRSVTATFVVSRPASVRLTVEVRRPGRRVGATCVPADLAPLGVRCTQVIIVRDITRALPAGSGSIAFRAKGLPRGVHRVRVTATDATGPKTAQRATLLRVVRR
jgi:hypothetical protein